MNLASSFASSGPCVQPNAWLALPALWVVFSDQPLAFEPLVITMIPGSIILSYVINSTGKKTKTP